MQLPKNINETAKKHFSDRFGKREYLIVHSASDFHPETRNPIYLVAAVLSGGPNERPVELILDEEARPLDLGHLRKRLFTRHIAPVPPEIIHAASVKVNPPVNNLRLGECDIFRET